MLGCWRLAVTLISARNRSAPTTAANSGFKTLAATLRSCLRSSARYTWPCRPHPTHARWRSDPQGLRSGGQLDRTRAHSGIRPGQHPTAVREAQAEACPGAVNSVLSFVSLPSASGARGPTFLWPWGGLTAFSDPVGLTPVTSLTQKLNVAIRAGAPSRERDDVVELQPLAGVALHTDSTIPAPDRILNSLRDVTTRRVLPFEVRPEGNVFLLIMTIRRTQLKLWVMLRLGDGLEGTPALVLCPGIHIMLWCYLTLGPENRPN